MPLLIQHGWLRLFLLLSFFGAATAFAADIPTVNLTASGPDMVPPLQQSFYLAGKVSEDVIEFQPIFVRFSFPPLAIHALPIGPRSCEEVRVALGDRKPATDAPTGVKGISELWGAGHDAGLYDSLNMFHKALALTPWKRDANVTGGQDYKILVPDSSFFQVGARYCLLLSEKKSFSRNDTMSVRKALLAFATADGKCNRDPNCEAVADKDLFKTIDTLTKMDPKAAEDIKHKVRGLASSVTNLKGTMEPLKALLSSWHAVLKPVDVTPLAPVSKNPLAQLIAKLMVRSGDLLAIPVKGNVRYYTSDGALEVNYIGVLENFDGLHLSEDPNAREESKHRVERIKLSRYALPDSSVTLLDLLELSRGRIRVDKTYVLMAEVYDNILVKTMGFNEDTTDLVAGDATPLRDAFVAQVSAIDKTLLDRVWVVLSPQRLESSGAEGQLREPKDFSGETVYKDIGMWLKSMGWRNDATRERGLVSNLATLLGNYFISEQEWRKNSDALTIATKEETARIAKPVLFETGVSLTQRTWIFSYVTPVYGSSLVFTQPGAFSLPYLGVQLYGWPNPVNQPMWTNGVEDLRRVVALELAMGLKSSGLGMEGRYGGAAVGLPPLLVGLSLQLLPYATVSGGLAIVSARHTSLDQEVPSMILTQYVSLTIQANVPDLIANLVRGGQSTAVDQSH